MRPGYCLLLAAALCFSSCVAKKPVPVGFVGPLTGPSSAVGLGARNGFLLALGEGPSAAPGDFGRSRLIVKDDENDPDKCLDAFRELRAEGCGIVILATTSQAAAKAIPWAMKEGMLVLSPTVSNASFSGMDDLFIRINTSSEAYGTKLAKTAFGIYGKRRVGVIGDSANALYVDAEAGAYKAEFVRQGGEVPFVLGFRSAEGVPAARLIAELERTRADGLVAVTASTEAAMIAKQIEKAALGIRMFLPPWPLTLDLIKNGGKAVEGAVAVSIVDMEYRSKEGRAFHAGYLAEYGEEPSFTAMFGYEAAAVLRRALATAKVSDPETVKRKLIELREFLGLQGSISFDKNGDASRDLFLFVVEDGKFKRIGQ